MNFTVLASFVRLTRTKHLWQTQKLDLFRSSAVCFPAEVYPGTPSACLFFGFFSDAPDVSGRDIRQIMSLLFFLSTWNTVLLPAEFRTDH